MSENPDGMTLDAAEFDLGRPNVDWVSSGAGMSVQGPSMAKIGTPFAEVQTKKSKKKRREQNSQGYESSRFSTKRPSFINKMEMSPEPTMN